MAIIKPETLHILGLFGRKHTINIDLKNNVQIIYGVNGSGKTTVLKLLHAILTGKLYEARNINFKGLILVLNDKKSLVVSRSNITNSSRGEIYRRNSTRSSINIRLMSQDGKCMNEGSIDDDIELSDRVPHEAIESEIPELSRIGRREWLDSRTGDMLNLGDVVERYSERLPWLQPSTQIEWYKELVGDFSVKFIQTQRLMTLKAENTRIHSRHGVRYQNTVIDYSEKLRELIRDKLNDSVRVSQTLDSTYPKRLLRGGKFEPKPTNANGEKLRDLLEKTELLGAKLRKVDLLSSAHDVDIEFEAISVENRRAISLYLDDTYKKYQVLEPFADKLLLFLDIINTKFKPSKTVTISGSDGISIGLKNGGTIHPQLLSSGEQHEIVLLFDLIFFLEPETLVLIDEPEISLHIDWQKKFLSDVEAIGKTADLKFVLATHSPAIIGSRIEICKEI